MGKYTLAAGWTAATPIDDGGKQAFIPSFQSVGPDGSPYLPAGTDRSGTITTGGTAQDVAPANATRRGMTFQNISDTAMNVSENGTAASASNGYLVAAGGMFRASTNKKISVYCATTGKAFAATEY